MYFSCTTCGWLYPAEEGFNGVHGRADVPPEDPTPCEDLATPVEEEPPS